MAREHAPYVLLGAAALLLRLPALDRAPLSSAEAASAWVAWGLAHGDVSRIAQLDQPPLSAALLGLQTALFWLVGGEDRVARLAPALIGAAVVVIAWLLRRLLRRTASIALAALLAFDPLSVGYSRLADGAMLVATASWVVIAALLVLAGTPTPGERAAWRTGLALAVGVALASGPLVWDLLPPLLAVALAVRPRRPIPGVRNHVVLVAAAASMVATSGLTQWAGPPLVATSLGAWLREWAPVRSMPPGDLWLSLLGYETLPLALGLGGLLATWSRPVSPILAGWLVWGCLLTLRGAPTPAAWLVIAPPLLLSAASAISQLASAVRTPDTRLTTMATRAALVATLVLCARFVHGAFEIAGRPSDSRFRPYGASTAADVRRLAGDLDLIQRRRLAERRLPVEIVVTAGVDPVLAWYLRDEPTLRWVAVPSPRTPETPGLIIAADDGPAVDARSYAVRWAGTLERVRLR